MHGICAQVSASSQHSGFRPVHGSPVPTHVPAPSHLSVLVQKNPSSHAVFTCSFVLVQTPERQASAVQSLSSVHVLVSSSVETHVPLMQASSVQSLPSLHALASLFV